MSAFPPPAQERQCVLSFGAAVGAHWEHEGKKKGGVTGVNSMTILIQSNVGKDRKKPSQTLILACH